MKIQVKNIGSGVESVAIQGDLDFHSAGDLRKEFAKLGERKVTKVLIDLKKVSYVDSSGLAAFVEFFQMTKEYSGKIAFCNLNRDVRNVFQISKLDSVFSLASNEKEALLLIAN